ncbi:hypothetical protein [Nonomuraea endophytica]|uniref:Exonuclease domain-containing protein n=1 Tax=Nonomuraea endophytica TaxID=714136 RepID=A0A7W8A842_9ACTN|nr:hypothetical protein [Nonomuraea endophytica]MBB5081299.1 hypothetical protein [Nonomuraea endophytica]
MTKLVFFDVKTTSLDDRAGHLWEIGLILREPGQDDTEFWWQIKPDMSGADPVSLNVSGYYQRCRVSRGEVGHAAELAPARIESKSDLCPSLNPGEVLDWVSAPTVATQLAFHLAGATVVGSNPSSDHRFGRKFLDQYGHCWTANSHLIDIRSVALGYLQARSGDPSTITPGVEWKPRELYDAFVDLHRYDAHTALDDARMARDTFDAITSPKAP